MTLKHLLFWLLCGISLNGQSLTFDEFFRYSHGILDSSQLAGIKEMLPEKFVITGADFGDISGDTLTDFAIAVRPSIRRSRDIYVYIFVDSSKSYIPVFSDTVKFVDLPIEVAFTISEKMCLITQKLDENGWLFRGYSFLNNELSMVDIYRTGSQVPDRRNKIGNEIYENYRTLNAFNGYYNQASLKDYKKNKYFNFPVYDHKRNVYRNYSQKVFITSSWLWNDSLVKPQSYGFVSFTKDNKFLTGTIDLNSKIFGSDSLINTYITLYFDRNPERLLKFTKKREPVFRETADENIGSVDIEVNNNHPGSSSVNFNFGRNYRHASLNSITLSGEKNLNSLIQTIRIPLNVFNTDTTEIGIYISIELEKNGSTILHLKNSDGSADDPSSYGRLKFIQHGKYYGSIKNHKFRELAEKLRKNSIIK